MRTIPAGEFKAKCLALMDEVLVSGEPIRISKRGKVIAWLTPPRDVKAELPSVDSIATSLRGVATMVGDPEAWIEPMVPEGDWEHQKQDWSPSGVE
jgi:antitoxin (DNA-binding transcriptional repressor) of toxin-antitoxin stability system